MIFADTLEHMDILSTRDVIGEVVRNEIKFNGWNYIDAPEKLGMSLSTLNRIMRGVTVAPVQYRKLERVLDLPRFILDAVLAADVKTIRATPELDPALKRQIIALLDRRPEATQRRRKSD